MTRAAQQARCETAAVDEVWPEHTAAYTLDRQVARAREEMGEERWREINREWER